MQTRQSLNTPVMSGNLLASSQRGLVWVKKGVPHMLEKVEPWFSEPKEEGGERDESVL